MIYQLEKSVINTTVDQELQECSSVRTRARDKVEQVQIGISMTSFSKSKMNERIGSFRKVETSQC